MSLVSPASAASPSPRGLIAIFGSTFFEKVRIFKLRRRKHYQKRQGHRQNFTELQIGSINV